MRRNLFEAETCESEEKYDLNSLELGSVIAKGSCAVVYEAREKKQNGKLRCRYLAEVFRPLERILQLESSDHLREYPGSNLQTIKENTLA